MLLSTRTDMKYKSPSDCAGPMTKEHGHLGHFAHPSVLEKGHNTNWIAGAIKHPGALTQQAHRAGESTMAFAKEHEHDSGVTGRRARLAETLSKLRK